jgi:putative hydrolase of the HAD superfamily
MTEITTLFWDVGGVLLTNGWDRRGRQQTAQKFHLDWEDFEDRHELIAGRFETGKLSFDRYLDRTVFYRERNFGKDVFKAYVFSLSQPIDGTLEVLGKVAHSGRYLLATLNNESREINLYRIGHFGLRKYFSFFMSSCFLGVKKPDDEMFRLALDLTQREPEECIFIDDRELNLECAARLRLRTLHFRNAAQIEKDLRGAGLEF